MFLLSNLRQTAGTWYPERVAKLAAVFEVDSGEKLRGKTYNKNKFSMFSDIGKHRFDKADVSAGSKTYDCMCLSQLFAEMNGLIKALVYLAPLSLPSDS